MSANYREGDVMAAILVYLEQKNLFRVLTWPLRLLSMASLGIDLKPSILGNKITTNYFKMFEIKLWTKLIELIGKSLLASDSRVFHRFSAAVMSLCSYSAHVLAQQWNPVQERCPCEVS